MRVNGVNRVNRVNIVNKVNRVNKLNRVNRVNMVSPAPQPFYSSELVNRLKSYTIYIIKCKAFTLLQGTSVSSVAPP